MPYPEVHAFVPKAPGAVTCAFCPYAEGARVHGTEPVEESQPMYVSATFRCPDEGENLVLLTVDSDGKVGGYWRLNMPWLLAAIEPLRASVEDLEENGGPSMDDFLAQRDLLGTLEQIKADIQT